MGPPSIDPIISSPCHAFSGKLEPPPLPEPQETVDHFAPVLDRLVPILSKSCPDSRSVDIPELPLTLKNILARIKGGIIYRLEIPLPAGIIHRGLLENIIGVDIAIAPGTTLVTGSQETITLGPGGELESGKLYFKGPKPLNPEDPDDYNFGTIATPQYLRLEKGRIFLKVDWGLNAGVSQFLVENLVGGITFNHRGEIDIARSAAIILKYPELPTENWSLTTVYEQLPRLMKQREKLDRNWDVDLDIDLGAFLDKLRFDAKLIMRGPHETKIPYLSRLYHDSGSGVLLAADAIGFKMDGLRSIEGTLFSPYLEFSKDSRRSLVAEQVSARIKNLELTKQSVIKGVMTLDSEGATLRLPGRFQPKPIEIRLHDSKGLELTAPFQLNQEGLVLWPNLERQILRTEGNPEFNAEMAAAGHAKVWVTPQGWIGTNAHFLTEIEAPFAWLFKDIGIGAMVFCNLDLYTEAWGQRAVCLNYSCQAPKAEVDWFNDKDQLKLHAAIERTENPSSPFGYRVHAPLLVQSFDLRASSQETGTGWFHGGLGWYPNGQGVEMTANVGNMKEFRFILEPDGTMNFSIETYRSYLKSFLSSVFLKNDMFSHIKVDRLRATLDEEELVITGEKEGEVFLDTESRGYLKVANFPRIPIRKGRLRIEKIRYDRKKEEAWFTGSMELDSTIDPTGIKNIPVELLGAGNKPAKFPITLAIKNALFTKDGFVLPSGYLYISTSETYSPSQTRWERTPHKKHYPFAPETRTSGRASKDPLASPSFWEIISAYGPGAISSIESIHEAALDLKHGTGQVDIDLPLGTGLRATFSRPSRIFARAETAPSLAGKKESLSKFFIKFEDPPDLCLTVGGACFFLPDEMCDFDRDRCPPPWRLKGVRLVTKKPPTPIRPSSPFDSPESHYAPYDKRGHVIATYSGRSGSQTFTEQLFDKLGITRNTFAQAGIPVEGPFLKVPLQFNQLKRLTAAAWPDLMALMDKQQIGLSSSLALNWRASPISLDLEIKPSVFNICTVPLGGTHREGKVWAQHPHIVIKPAPKTHLRGKYFGNDRFTMGGMSFPRVGFYPGIEHRVGQSAITQDRIPKTLEFVRAEQVNLSDWVIQAQANRFTAQGTIDIEKVLAQLKGKKEAHFLNVHVVNPYYQIETSLKPAQIGAERLIFGNASFKDHKRGLGAEIAPELRGVYAQFINREFLEIGARTFYTKGIALTHPHFSLHGTGGIHATGAEVFIPIHVDETNNMTIASDRTMHFQAEKFRIDKGSGTLRIQDDTFEITGESSAREVLLSATPNRINFEAGEIDVRIDKIPVQFIKKLSLPKGLTIEEINLEDVRLTGIIRDSWLQQNDITLQGQLRMRTSGEAWIHFGDQEIQTPLKLDIKNIPRMVLVHEKPEEPDNLKRLRLKEMFFGGATLELDDIDASLNIANIFEAEFGQVFGIGKEVRPSSMTFGIEAGDIIFQEIKGRNVPNINLRGMGVVVKGYSKDASFRPRLGNRRLDFRYHSVIAQCLLTGDFHQIYSTDGDVTRTLRPGGNCQVFFGRTEADVE